INPAGVYCYTHETISYRRDLVTLQEGVGEDNFHNFYLTANSKSNGGAYLGWIPHHEPGRFTDVVPEDVCRVPSRSEQPFFHFADRDTNLPELRTTATH